MNANLSENTNKKSKRDASYLAYVSPIQFVKHLSPSNLCSF